PYPQQPAHHQQRTYEQQEAHTKPPQPKLNQVTTPCRHDLNCRYIRNIYAKHYYQSNYEHVVRFSHPVRECKFGNECTIYNGKEDADSKYFRKKIHEILYYHEEYYKKSQATSFPKMDKMEPSISQENFDRYKDIKEKHDKNPELLTQDDAEFLTITGMKQYVSFKMDQNPCPENPCKQHIKVIVGFDSLILLVHLRLYDHPVLSQSEEINFKVLYKSGQLSLA
ncbi:MAG: hypothetical protein HRT90_07160, partial [Candidatus Margulisbacteria bacterium]|nr:hypothetical protein [Candidatus Margulisiibacteriota bacterium]